METLKKNGIILGLGATLVVVFVLGYTSQNKPKPDFTVSGDNYCNISVIEVGGYLDTERTDSTLSSLDVAQAIKQAALDNTFALLFLTDSYGGTPAAAAEIEDALRTLHKPSITFVRGASLSGAYWVSSVTDYIVALEPATIGNIGVTSSYLDEIQLNSNEGYTYQEIVSGEYKEVGNVNKPLTYMHRQYLQKLNDDIFEIFKQRVMDNRGLTQEEFDKVADAKMYLANEALELNLIDKVGGIVEVKQWLGKRLNIPSDDVVLCEPIIFGY